MDRKQVVDRLSEQLTAPATPKQQAISGPISGSKFPAPRSQTNGRIPKVEPTLGSITYTIGLLESRTGGSTSWILSGVWVPSPCSLWP